MRALALLGEYRELQTRLPAMLEECRQRRDLYGDVSLRGSVHYSALLAQGLCDEARDDVESAEARWSPLAFTTQHYYFLTAKANIALYAGRHEDALRLTSEVRTGVERSLLKRVQSVRVVLYALCGRAALCSDGAAELTAPALAQAERYAKLLRRENVEWATPQADLLSAGVFARKGKPEDARRLLEAAAGGFDAVDMRLHAACTRYRLGRLIGGEQGSALVSEALAWLHMQRIVKRKAMIELLAPGLP